MFEVQDLNIEPLIQIAKMIISYSLESWTAFYIQTIRFGLGLISLFNGISTFVGYSMPKPFY